MLYTHIHTNQCNENNLKRTIYETHCFLQSKNAFKSCYAKKKLGGGVGFVFMQKFPFIVYMHQDAKSCGDRLVAKSNCYSSTREGLVCPSPSAAQL